MRTGSGFIRKVSWVRAARVAVGLAALILPAAGAVAQVDFTDAMLPHAADSYYPYGDTYLPAKVSDNATGLYASWHSADSRQGAGFPHWIQIDFGDTPRAVNQLNILPYWDETGQTRLRDFWFEGSDDGLAFTPLHEAVQSCVNEHRWQSFAFVNNVSYRFYRLRGLSNWAEPSLETVPTQMIIEEWEMLRTPLAADRCTWSGLKATYR